jgi:hypothetical protein
MDPVVTASLVAAIPATIAAWAGISNKRSLKTNHGKKAGQNIDGLVEWADATTVSMRAHQESDNDLRVALGLDPVVIEFKPVHSGHDSS